MPHPRCFVRCRTSYTPILRVVSGWALTQGPRAATSRGIELMPRLARVQRVDPDKDPVRGQELITNFIREGLVINGGFGIDADGA